MLKFDCSKREIAVAMKKRNRRNDRGGYVLIMTLMILAIVVLILTGIANRSLSLAAEAVLEERALQKRWQSISCQHGILGNARSVLKYDVAEAVLKMVRENPEDNEELIKALVEWPSSMRIQLRFNDESFTLVLADENCKANLAWVRRSFSTNQAMRLATELVATSQMSLRSTAEAGQSWVSWGQLFQSNSQTTAVWPGIEMATENVTLWGNGKINYLRCSDEVLRGIAELTLLRNEARRFLEIRNAQPYLTVAEWLAMSQLNEQDQMEISRWLDDKSSTYSLWIRSEDSMDLEFHSVTFGNSKPQYRSYVW